MTQLMGQSLRAVPIFLNRAVWDIARVMEPRRIAGDRNQALTVAGITVVISAACFYLGRPLPKD